MSVVIDGVDRTIATTQDVVEYLAANEGKVFAVDWTLNPYRQHYGFVDEARLVNEANDINVEDDVNYLTGDVIFGNGVIVTGEDSYRVNSDTVFVGGDAVNNTVYANNGIWVAYSSDGQQLVADVVYIGEKLDESTALNVTSAANDKATVGETTYSDDRSTGSLTITYAKGVERDTLTYTAKDANSVVINTAGGVELHWNTDFAKNDNPSRTVTVWNEAGTASTVYTITLDWYEVSTDATLQEVQVNGGTATLPWAQTDANSVWGGNGDQFITYLNAKEGSFSMTAEATSNKSTVSIGYGMTLADAVTNLSERESVTIDGVTAADAEYIVVKVVAEDGVTTNYYLFNTGTKGN